jgi:hypothetical protein
LLVHASTVGTPKGASNEARMEARCALRECAGRFLSAANSVRWWWLARLFRMVDKPEGSRLTFLRGPREAQKIRLAASTQEMFRRRSLYPRFIFRKSARKRSEDLK